MSKFKALITEKTSADAKNGKFTFLVDTAMTKYQIMDMIEKAFSVHVVSITTANKKSEKKRSNRGKTRFTKEIKKAIVTLKDSESIDLFEVKNS
jgi:large subunit ribosomal protein L23